MIFKVPSKIKKQKRIIKIIDKMKMIRFLVIILTGIMINSCRIVKPPVITKNYPIKEYKYVFIPTTNSLTSGSGRGYGSPGAAYGSSVTKSVNPSDVISGVLLKEGFMIIPEMKQEFADKTLIVNYGESGRRNVGGGGYTIEVTIKFISAKSHETMCSCTAEGMGQTEADDIRIAINRCLSALFSK